MNRYQPPTGPTPAQQRPLEIKTPYNLLRFLLKSIELKVMSGHAKRFLRQRALDEWRIYKDFPDADIQRLQMERAGAVIGALHKKTTGNPGEAIEWDFSGKKSRSGSLIDDTSENDPRKGPASIPPPL